MSKKVETAPPLWRCPRCGHRFVTRNMWHSCGRYRLADHFVGRPPALRKTFDRYVAVARTFGPVTVYAQKTRIVLQRRVRFAGVVVRKQSIDAALWLRSEVEHPLLTRTEFFGSLGYGCHFRLCEPGDVDPALVKLIGEAYAAAERRDPARPKD